MLIEDICMAGVERPNGASPYKKARLHLVICISYMIKKLLESGPCLLATSYVGCQGGLQ